MDIRRYSSRFHEFPSVDNVSDLGGWCVCVLSRDSSLFAQQLSFLYTAGIHLLIFGLGFFSWCLQFYWSFLIN